MSNRFVYSFYFFAVFGVRDAVCISRPEHNTSLSVSQSSLSCMCSSSSSSSAIEACISSSFGGTHPLNFVTSLELAPLGVLCNLELRSLPTVSFWMTLWFPLPVDPCNPSLSPIFPHPGLYPRPPHHALRLSFSSKKNENKNKNKITNSVIL